MQPHPNSAISGHLRLREGKRGATWYAKYRGPFRLEDGRLITKQTEAKIGPAWKGNGRPPAGTYTGKTAQAWLDAKLTDLRRGDGIPTAGGGATLAEAAAEWYRHGCNERAWKPATRRDYRSALSAHLGVDLDPNTGALIAARAPFGDMPLEQITTDTIERWRAGAMKPYTDEKGIERVKLPRRTAVKVVAILHGIFTRARKPPFNITTNPVDNVEPLRLRYNPEDYDFYSIEEVLALARAAADEQDGAIFLTAAFTGLRMGELLALRVRDVDFGAEAIRVMRSVDTIEGIGTPKSGKGRTVTMVPQVAQTLARLLDRDHLTDDEDLVFPNEVGRWLDGSALRRRYKDAQTAAGLQPLRFHDLRHTFGSLAIRNLNELDVKNLMGHADPRTTARYTHHKPRSDEARRLSQAFEPEKPQQSEDVSAGEREAKVLLGEMPMTV